MRCLDLGGPLCICNSCIRFTPVIGPTSVPLYSATITQLSSYVQEYLYAHNGYCVQEDTHTTISIFTVCSLLHCNSLHDTAITDQLLRWISGQFSLVVSGQLSPVVSGQLSLVVSGQFSLVVSGQVSLVVSGQVSLVVSGSI